MGTLLRQSERESFPIVVVTLARDNPEELKVTSQSVAQQFTRPDLYLILDSSAEELVPVMKSLAHEAGAQYMWVEPEGIYAAMRSSLDFIPHESYVLWLNSSDMFAGRESINILKRESDPKAGCSSRPPWFTGKLVRALGNQWGVHDNAPTGKKVGQAMRAGFSGFAHPATLFRADCLFQVSPYASNLTIAEDYATALRFLKRFGAPHLVDFPISIHVPNGLSALAPVRGFFERSKARLETGGFVAALWEPVAFSLTALRGVWQKIYRSVGRKPNRRTREQVLAISHFCEQGRPQNWPTCCAQSLGNFQTR